MSPTFEFDSITSPSVVAKPDARVQAAKQRFVDRASDPAVPADIAAMMQEMVHEQDDRDEWGYPTWPAAPCPSWCTLGERFPEHSSQYDSRSPETGFTRTHERYFGADVTIVQDEYHDGQTATFEPAFISVWIDRVSGTGIDQRDSSGAVRLAADLCLAAAKLQQIQQS